MTATMDSIYAYLWDTAQGQPFTLLDHSLNPRPPRMLYDLVKTAGITTDSLLLDVGCGQGHHTFDLARQHGCRVLGIDPVLLNLQTAQRLTILDQRYRPADPQRVTFQLAAVEALPLPDDSIDLIWCRDMLVHVANLEQGIRECRRVLKPDGTILVLHTFATDLMEPKELAAICEPIGVQVANLAPDYMETIFKSVGLNVEIKEDIGAEFIEHIDERDGRYSKELLRVGRMVRAEDYFRAELGDAHYELALAVYRWSIYLLLGKLSMTIYLLRKT
ncbi:MAG: methyltransferase domain-containing protein [Chloroflexota bacterium]